MNEYSCNREMYLTKWFVQESANLKRRKSATGFVSDALR